MPSRARHKEGRCPLLPGLNRTMRDKTNAAHGDTSVTLRPSIEAMVQRGAIQFLSTTGHVNSMDCVLAENGQQQVRNEP